MRLNYQKNIIFLAITISTLLIDQCSKYLIKNNLDVLLNKSFFIFSIDYIHNYGAAFNILNGNRLLLSSISVISSLLLIYIIFIRNKSYKINKYALSLILSGSIGNGIDRIINGYVIDFLKINFISFPVFNIADILINIGFIILIFNYLKYK